jgi:hypothetical protein
METTNKKITIEIPYQEPMTKKEILDVCRKALLKHDRSGGGYNFFMVVARAIERHHGILDNEDDDSAQHPQNPQ